MDVSTAVVNTQQTTVNVQHTRPPNLRNVTDESMRTAVEHHEIETKDGGAYQQPPEPEPERTPE